MTTKVTMHEAKSRLSELGELVWNGERVIIAKAGKPYLDLLPYKEVRRTRVPGRLAGRIEIAPDFDATPEALVNAFEADG